MAKWRIWRIGIWRTGSYGKSTMANQHMVKRHMAKRRRISSLRLDVYYKDPERLRILTRIGMLFLIRTSAVYHKENTRII